MGYSPLGYKESDTIVRPTLALWASQVALVVKNLPATEGDIKGIVQSQGQENSIEGGMGTHCSILDWRIPWTEEPGWLQSMGSQRVGHN